MQVTVDIDDINPLPSVPLLIRMIQDLHQTALLDRGNDALERDAPLLNKLPVFLQVPVKASLHRSMVIQCVHVVNIVA